MPRTKHCRLAILIALAAAMPAGSSAPAGEWIWIGLSASDRYLACAARDGRLRMYDLVDGGSRDIPAAAVDGGFAWAPDDDCLAFCTRRKGHWDLALAYPTGRVDSLTNDSWRDFHPAWAPDGRGIYFVSSCGGGYQGDYDVRYYDLTARRSLPLISGPHDQVEPRVSPDGRWLATVSYQDGNPLVLVYAVKTLRVIQIPLSPQFRGGQLHLETWLGDSRRLTCRIENQDAHHLAICEIDSERWEILESSDAPFASVVADRRGRDLLCVVDGRVYRHRPGARWRKRRRLDFGDLPVTRVAAGRTDDRIAAVVAEGLVGLAPSPNAEPNPLVGSHQERLFWGDLELQLGHARQGFRHYESALRRIRETAGDDAASAVAKARLSRAVLLCRLGHARRAAGWLRRTSETLQGSMNSQTRQCLFTLLALNEFVWNENAEAGRARLDEASAGSDDGPADSDAALLRGIRSHRDENVRQTIRCGIKAFWREDLEKGTETFVRLLASHPADPVVQTAYRRALIDQFALPRDGVFRLPAADDDSRKALADMAARYPAIAGEHFEMDRDWFGTLVGALLALRDASGLKTIGLRYGPQFMSRRQTLALYRRYRAPGKPTGRDDFVFDETLAMVLFDPQVLKTVHETFTEPPETTDVRLASARRALIAGDDDKLKRILRDVARDIERLGAKRVFGDDDQRSVAFALLRGALDERLGAWDRAVARYREAADVLQRQLKTRTREGQQTGALRSLLAETRFRGHLLQRGAAAREELTELLIVERAVGDSLMTYSTDPASVLNGVHNYFALLARVGTPWIRDLIYLRAGQTFRRLDRWGEAAFCLRVAKRTNQPFLERRVRAELVDLFAALDDAGLADWHTRH